MVVISFARVSDFFIKTSLLSLVNGAAVQAMNGVEEQAVSTGKFEHFNP